MNKAISLFCVIGIAIPISAMEAEKKDRFLITADTIAEHEETFKAFIKELEQKKWPALQKLPDPDTLLGSIAVGAINVVLKNFTRIGEVRPKETGIFLGRVFETTCREEHYKVPDIIQHGIDALKKGSPEHFEYINGVLNNLDNTTLRKRDLARLAETMDAEKKKHPDMPGTRNMGNKEEVPDATFAPFAVAQLFTTCCVEEKLLLDEVEKHSKHPHRSKKRDSREA